MIMAWQTTLESMQANWPGAVTPQSAYVIMVQRLAALLQENARLALVPHGLSFTEFEMLAALRSAPPPHELIPSALYDALLISSGGLTKVLKSLERRGLIARPQRDGDRRRRPVALTSKGCELAEAAMRSVQKADAERLRRSQQTDADYRQLAQLTEAVLSALERS
jgi:DNA-binding MarR family transcriptional regulator